MNVMVAGQKKLSDLALGSYVMEPVEGTEDQRLTDVQRILMRYLEKKTGGERMAMRDDVVPAEIAPFLSSICIVNLLYDDEGGLDDITHQIVGTAVADFYGEMTGKSAKDYTNPAISAMVFKISNRVVANKRAMVYHADHPNDDELKIGVNNLFVPLSQDGETVDQIFFHLTPIIEH